MFTSISLLFTLFFGMYKFVGQYHSYVYIYFDDAYIAFIIV